MTQIICITCPKGCHLSVDEQNGYERVVFVGQGPGALLALLAAALLPKARGAALLRVVTSTVRIEGASIARLPVKTDRPLPKEKMRDCMALLDWVTAVSPVRTGQVLAAGILGTDVNIVATKDL